MWQSPIIGRRFPVPVGIVSRHTANAVVPYRPPSAIRRWVMVFRPPPMAQPYASGFRQKGVWRRRPGQTPLDLRHYSGT